MFILGSHTCGFSLDLPEYSTTEILYERLNYAIFNCSSIDGDGNLNEGPDSTDTSSDSNDDLDDDDDYQIYF